ncbi:MAG: hypothetical protein FJX92_08840 [Bacteroidetes bacterium]|nr:hypothetical protein [Bacteroidota bacterium]
MSVLPQMINLIALIFLVTCVENRFFKFEAISMGKKFGFSFSWKRAMGISSLRTSFARRSGVPTTKGGLQRKIGAFILNLLFKRS